MHVSQILASLRLLSNLDSSPECVSVIVAHTVQWAAPEILDEDIHSKEADVFAFAMVMIEVRVVDQCTACRPSAYFHFGSIQVFTGADSIQR
jgi:hypothetical protein